MFESIQPQLQRAANWTLVAAFLFFPAAMALGNIAILLAGLLGILSGVWWQRRGEWRGAFFPWIVIALYMLVLAGALWSDAPWEDIALKYTKYLKLFLGAVFFTLLAQQSWRTRCLQAFGVCMLFILASTYANIFVHLPWSKTQNLGWGVDHTVIGDYITQNIMMSFFVVLALWFGVNAVQKWQRVAGAVVAALAAVAITQLSQGRTGYVLVLMGVCCFVFFSLRGWLRWAALAAVIALVVGAVALSDTAVQRAQQAIAEARNSDQMEITSIGGRINFWTHTWELVKEKPIQGWGTGSYHQQWCRTVTKPGWCEFGGWHPHNQYLLFWVENGVVALLLFVALMVSLVVAVWRDDRWRPLTVSFVAILAMNSLLNVSLWSSRESHFFALMLCLLSAQAYFGKRATAAPTMA
jgi:O-antigen ligase